MMTDPRYPDIAKPHTGPQQISAAELTYPAWAYSAREHRELNTERREYGYESHTDGEDRDPEEMADILQDRWERDQFGRWDQ